MASTSASSVQKSFKYDVFLSFRGEDTRKTFVDHLYHALHQKSIITYKDDEKIQKGERIDGQLLRSIEESRFHIIVFSKNYASSSWCLDELVKIMECQKTEEQTAYPIFYDVEPTEVRHQSGSVGEAFAKHENEMSSRKRKMKMMLEDVDQENEDDVGRWRNALKEAASLAGMELKTTFNGHEAKFIQQIVQDISLKLRFIDFRTDGKLVGMETRVKNVVSSLEIGSEDVRMIGIKGMGGGGKTTLARAIFDHISIWFEGKSFVENVREVSKGSSSGLNELQKQILQDAFNDEKIKVTSVYDGKYTMKKMMCCRKVLVVLDDVDDKEQLEALAGEFNWFMAGSRIIITTRDEQVLKAQQVNFIHDVSLLSNEEAICLFSRYAFGRDIPNEGYEELSGKVVQYAAGLPLTLKVLGSHLCGRSEHEWIDAIERLERIPLEKTLKRLELSYDGLENDQKEIFLDVACLLKGESKDRAIRALESCGFNARIGLGVLEQKSLITISDHRLGMHDHIQEMGCNIVRRFHPEEPNKHSRLWITKEIEEILLNESGTTATRSIILKHSQLHPEIIMKGLKKMKDLKFLFVDYNEKWQVYDVRHYLPEDALRAYKTCEVDEVSHYLPDSLRFLHWYRYPFSSLPKTFRANKLVSLEMPGSNIIELWEAGERKVLDELKYIDISWSTLKTIDLMHYECPKLKYLNLSGTNVSNLNLGMTPYLEELHLETCYQLQQVHAPVRCLKKLVYLKLSHCFRFKYFEVSKCNKSSSLDPIATLELTAESLDTCRLHPSSILPKFQFKCKYNETLPSSTGNLKKLISFGLCACTNLESFSTSICGLQHLRELRIEGSIPEVLNDLWQLETLNKLSLSLVDIKDLPDSICRLKHLKYLYFISCWLLERLPVDLGSLECLERLDLTDCRSLRDIPNSISNMKCLKYLTLSDCILVEKLPEELEVLTCLEVLDIGGTGINCLPQGIYELKGMYIIGSRGQLQSYGFTEISEQEYYCYVQL